MFKWHAFLIAPVPRTLVLTEWVNKIPKSNKGGETKVITKRGVVDTCKLLMFNDAGGHLAIHKFSVRIETIKHFFMAENKIVKSKRSDYW